MARRARGAQQSLGVSILALSSLPGPPGVPSDSCLGSLSNHHAALELINLAKALARALVKASGGVWARALAMALPRALVRALAKAFVKALAKAPAKAFEGQFASGTMNDSKYELFNQKP